MPRTNRIAPGGWVFHVLNRGNGRMRIFDKDGDYRAFETLLSESLNRFRLRLLCYCLMPNHWHLVLWPRADGDLGRFMQRLTTTHVRRWHLHRHTVGHGHLYQGLYKSFPIQQDEHFLTVCRYVERNPLRANLVERAQDWHWSSLSLTTPEAGGPPRTRANGEKATTWRTSLEGATLAGRSALDRGGPGADGRTAPVVAEAVRPTISDWPVSRPRQWLAIVNRPQSPAEEEGLRRSVQRGRPFGGSTWEKLAATRLGLQSTLSPRGRPRKEKES